MWKLFTASARSWLIFQDQEIYHWTLKQRALYTATHDRQQESDPNEPDELKVRFVGQLLKIYKYIYIYNYI